MVIDYIKEIRDTQGTNAKLQLLESYSKDDIFCKVLYYAYNPFFKYHIRKIPKVTPASESIMGNYESMFLLLDDLRTRKYTGNLAIEMVSTFIKNTSDEIVAVFILILDRDVNMGINTKSINKVIPNLIPTFDVMLADANVNIDVLFNTHPYLYVQKKSDGKRCIAICESGDIKFFARSGKEIDNMYLHTKLISNINDIRETIGYDFILDGEVIIVNSDGSDADRQYSNGLINRKDLHKSEVERFSYIVWDLIPFEEFTSTTYTNKLRYTERFNLITTIIANKLYDNLKVIETFKAYDSIEVQTITNKFISQGFEGSIVKTPEHYYERKRSKSWIKFKKILEADLRVVGFVYGVPGTKYETMLGALELESEDGRVKVSVGSGFTDDDRMSITESIIGSIITVQYNQLIENKNGGISLYLPRFVEIRDDKEVADTLDKIKRNG